MSSVSFIKNHSTNVTPYHHLQYKNQSHDISVSGLDQLVYLVFQFPVVIYFPGAPLLSLESVLCNNLCDIVLRRSHSTFDQNPPMPSCHIRLASCKLHGSLKLLLESSFPPSSEGSLPHAISYSHTASISSLKRPRLLSP